MLEKKSFITFKVKELFDQLLNSIEEEIWDPSKRQARPEDWPLWLSIKDSWNSNLEPSPMDMLNLTRPFRADESPRLINPGAYRNWAMIFENWARIIPEGKELLLECAWKHNDDEFAKMVGRFGRRADKGKARK